MMYSPLPQHVLLLWRRLEQNQSGTKIPPPTPTLPAPSVPSIPGPVPPGRGPGSGGRRPPLELLPSGPFDARAPLAWDDHVYPDPQKPSEEVYLAHGAAYNGVKLIADALRRKPTPSLPAPKPAPRLPGRTVPRLPAVAPAAFAGQDQMLSSTAEELLQAPAASGLVSANPLELLDDYLKAQGIRYFSAWEITQHKWRHTRQVVPNFGDKRSSAWAHLYDFFSPQIVPKGVHFALARCVVPHPDLWPSILPSLWVLDRFRHWLDKPVAAISGYRHPWYNTQIDGSTTSFHMGFAAVDFTYGARRPDGHLDTEVFVRFFERLYRKQGDGVGRYGTRFIHLDVGMDRHKIEGKGLNWWRPRELKGVLK